MKLSDYPRPPADNGRGIHWSPSQYQWGRKEWIKWQDRILELGFKWVKIIVPPDYNAIALAKRLIDIEVMPVCRFVSKNPSRLAPAVEGSIHHLVDLGVRYFETNNEPDADVEWEAYKKPQQWEELVLQNLIYDAQRIQQIGGIPALVAFNSGPTEPRNPIQILVSLPGGREVADAGMWVSLHNYGKGRPFNYPNDRIRMFGDPITDEEWTNQGQPDFWTQADVEQTVWRGLPREQIDQLRARQKDPNITIMTDITCFRAYEYWHQIITAEGLDPLPTMMTEGGWETDDGIDDFYPQPTAVVASSLNRKMFEFLQGSCEMTLHKPDGSTETRTAPDYLFALMPWHMGERAFGLDTSGQWEQGAWFSNWHDQKYGLNGELPIIQMLRDLPSRVRANGPVPPQWAERRHLNIMRLRELGRQFLSLRQWDYRFRYLGAGVTIEPPNTTGPAWRVVAGYWQDKDERNPEQPLPPGYIMVKVLDQDGQPIENAAVEIDRGDAADAIRTKGQFDNYLGNYQMTATLGTYSVRVTQDGHPSARVLNVGLGGEEPDSQFDRTAFLFVFRLIDVSQIATNLAEEIDQLQEPEPAEAVETPAKTVPQAAPEPQPQPAPALEAEPEPEPESKPAPEPEQIPTPSPSPAIENNAAELGVTVSAPSPDAECVVKRVYRYQPADRMAPNTLFVDLLDAAGERVYGSFILLEDAGGHKLRVAVEKPLSEPGGNTPMWGENVYRVVGIEQGGRVIDSPVVSNLQAAYPGTDGGQSFLIVLQLVQD